MPISLTLYINERCSTNERYPEFALSCFAATILPYIPPKPMQTIEFKLTTEFVELCNLLKLAGLADSGGRGKAMVAEGMVRVDGKPENRKTAKIRNGQTVECNVDRSTVTIHVTAANA